MGRVEATVDAIATKTDLIKGVVEENLDVTKLVKGSVDASMSILHNLQNLPDSLAMKNIVHAAVQAELANFLRGPQLRLLLAPSNAAVANEALPEEGHDARESLGSEEMEQAQVRSQICSFRLAMPFRCMVTSILSSLLANCKL